VVDYLRLATKKRFDYLGAIIEFQKKKKRALSFKTILLFFTNLLLHLKTFTTFQYE